MLLPVGVIYSVCLQVSGVLQGPFRVYGAKASRQVFLFEREILISKKKEGGMLGCKASIQVTNPSNTTVEPK